MKIIHICGVYIDRWGYQDNLLPHYQALLGHEVAVLTPNRVPKFAKQNKTTIPYFIDKVKIIRLNCLLYITYNFYLPMKLYKNLRNENPDLIFHHGVNCTTYIIAGLYKFFNRNCTLQVDNHADEINCIKNTFWKSIYYNFILKICCSLFSSLVTKYYGVTHSRIDFLINHFRIDKAQIDLLPIGADVEAISKIEKSLGELRVKNKIPQESYVICSGGKMGHDKGTDVLLNVINELNQNGQNIILILFGSFSNPEFGNLAKETKNVVIFDWCDRSTTLEILKLADLAIWPMHHTTLIEDAIASLTPIIIRKTRTTEHLIDGNGIPLIKCDNKELKYAILQMINQNFNDIIKENCIKMKNSLSYYNVAQKTIHDTIKFEQTCSGHSNQLKR